MSFYRWFVYGDVDWERLQSAARDYCPTIAGAIFGVGWWVFVDSLVVSSSAGVKVPIVYHIPGWIATLSLVRVMSFGDQCCAAPHH